MGEAKRRKELGIEPRIRGKDKEQSNKNNLNSILNKYPYFPYILGFAVITILIIDLMNYYK